MERKGGVERVRGEGDTGMMWSSRAVGGGVQIKRKRSEEKLGDGAEGER